MAKPTRFTRQLIEENLKKGIWELTTFSEVWDGNARDFPDKEAVVDSTHRLTWRQANEWIDRLALAFLEAGIKKDEVVVIQLPNSADLVLTRVACERAGLVFLPVLRSYRHKEVKQFLNMTRAAALVIPWRLRDFDYVRMVEEIRPEVPHLRHVFVTGDEATEGALSIRRIVAEPPHGRYPISYLQQTRCPATEFSMILPTSGTTGFPKLCENPIMTIVVRERACIRNLKLSGQDVFGIISPAPGGSNGRCYYAAPLVAGKIVCLEHWEAEKALKLIQKERVTVAPLVPTQLIQILKHPDFGKYDLSSLRLVLCMGAVLPYHLAEEAENRLGGKCKLIQQYSAVGCSVACMGMPEESRQARFLTVGKPYAGAEVRIVDDNGREVAPGEVGEINLRGPAGDSGYYNDPEATRQAWTEDGWFHTGDLGKLDDEGRLLIAGRKKDMIIRGGQNIYPTEIEAILSKHPKIMEVAVVAMPDPVMGEKACAYVAPRPGQTVTLEEIVAFLREQNIVPYKLPERLEVMDKLPMVGDGQKVDKKALQADVAGKLSPL